MKAIFDFGPDAWVERAWYVALDEADWMAVLWRDGDKPWRAVYRFRYYMDDKVGMASDDLKRVYELGGLDGTAATRDAMVAVLNDLFMLLQAADGGAARPRWTADIKGGPDKFVEATRGQPWMHAQVVPSV